LGNQFLYDQGTGLTSHTGYYDLFFRNYDPTLARFLQVDPLASSYHNQTPYQYANNDPVYWNDPLGNEPASSGWAHIRKSRAIDAERNAFNSYFVIGDDITSRRMFGSAFPKIGPGNSLNEQYWNSMISDLHAARRGDAAALQRYAFQNGETFVYRKVGEIGSEFYNVWTDKFDWVQLNFSAELGLGSQQTQGGSTSSDFIYDNNNSIGLGLEIIENGTTEGIEEVLKNKALYTTGAKIGTKVVGGSVIGLNLGVTFYTIGKELQSSDPKAFNTHSFVNMGVTAFTTGATAIGIIFAGATAPVWVPAVAIAGAAVGIGYGIAQVAGIDEWIDSRYGFK